MCFVIYKYVLKPGKILKEVEQWMRENEALQARWGALEADFQFSDAGRQYLQACKPSLCASSSVTRKRFSFLIFWAYSHWGS